MLKEGGSADNHLDKVNTNTYLITKNSITFQDVEGTSFFDRDKM